MVIDTTATPVMAQALIRHIRSVTDLPIKYVVLSHYHAVRVLGASAYFEEGAEQIIASRGTYELIVERGEQDMKSEIERFPRLFAGVESVPGLSWPTMVFDKEMTIFMGKLEVKLMHIGMGHTKGDTIAWMPSQKICFSGDLVEYDAAAYTGDAQLEEWPATLEALRALGAEKLVPGRGPALMNPEQVNSGHRLHQGLRDHAAAMREGSGRRRHDPEGSNGPRTQQMDPKFSHVFIYEHCLPFDVTRAVRRSQAASSIRASGLPSATGTCGFHCR
jgi:glyoxylase-like metal-dependent hydrolase (beta-lactamase superfamily II)